MNEPQSMSSVTADAPCPCGSGSPFAACCEPLLDGNQAAVSAEALMRSRYSAYVSGRLEYLRSSLHPEHRNDMDLAATRRWAQGARWLGLQILASEAGGRDDQEGMVEFIATYKEKGLTKPHHERANFRRHEGLWYYVDGKIVPVATEMHDRPKVGRNEPCPCGSGKKYKKCCGR